MRKVHGKRKEDGLKRERENERNEGLEREGEKCRFWRESGKKVKEGSEESDWRVWRGKRERRLGVKEKRELVTMNWQLTNKPWQKHNTNTNTDKHQYRLECHRETTHGFICTKKEKIFKHLHWIDIFTQVIHSWHVHTVL